jgi:hypothetical protein
MKALIFLLLSALSVSAQAHFSKAYHLKNDVCLIVEDGRLEDPGQGSYTIKLNKWMDHSSWPAGSFYSGIVRPRDGTVENVLFVDLDGKKDVVVTIRSIGTGGYLDADAFAVDGKKLVLLGKVTNLKPDQNVVEALTREIGKH